MPLPSDPSRRLPSERRTTFEWNTILRCAAPRQALSLYARCMLFSGAQPNKFTFTFLLQACLRSSSLIPFFVPLLHAHLTVIGLHRDPFLRSALVSAYADAGRLPAALRVAGPAHARDVVLHTALVSAFGRSGRPDLAQKAFDEMPHPNPVSWAALVSAYAQSCRDAEALAAFRRMRGEGVVPTEAALVSVLASAARAGALVDGECAHRDAVLFHRLTPGLGTALLAMYSKCGRIDSARRAFDEMTHRDQPSWAAMITALASHGRGREAIGLFEEMVGLGLRPDGVTYVGVLHACSHSGLVAEARRFFDEMVRVHRIEPAAEHYGCMVDVLGRSGEVEAAWEMARSMPVAMAADERVLKSLLSSCCAHGLLKGAEWAAGRLMAADAGQASSYVLLSNAYAALGRWEDCARVRKLMRTHGVPKAPGCSAVD